MVTFFLVQMAFVLINIAIAAYQAHRFDKEQKRIKHWLWAIYYGALVTVSWPIHKDWYLIYAITSMHLWLFNPVLNYLRTPRKPFFYTNPEDPQGSYIDKLWMDVYPAVFCGAFISYLVAQIFIYA